MTEEAVPPSSTFRIFVSSTFSDLKAERDALQRYVFPRLRELCARHRQHGRFQAIDLRWGVSEEASLDQRTVPICLTEIERCRRLTPRPNFVVLLGDRYGWRPLPAEIPAEEFKPIAAEVVDAEKKALLETWYRLDKNAVPALHCLSPRAGEFVERTAWESVERRLQEILLAAIANMNLSDEARAKYGTSATEQEIVRGALEVADAREHVFCFLRSIANLDELAMDIPPERPGRRDDRALAEDFIDLVDPKSDREPDKKAAGQLEQLKSNLATKLPGNIRTYDARWQEDEISLDHIGSLPDSFEECQALLKVDKPAGTLCLDVWRSLGRVIQTQLDELETIEPLHREIWSHNEFGRDRARHFVGRADELEAIAAYVEASDPSLMAVLGEPGSGKSALMAEAAVLARAAHPGAVSVLRFVGATPPSSDGRSLLDSLCREISRAYEVDESDVPSEFNELTVELAKRLELASAEKPLVVFLDALNQLGGADPARSLSWLPAQLPEHVHVVVSTLAGDCEQALRSKHPQPRFVTLEAMSTKEGKKLLGHWLERAGRKLQEDQEREVLGKFASEGLPLYLKLASEEARLWRSHTAGGQTVLEEGVPALIRDNLFRRLAAAANHGSTLVSHSLGYLAASRHGLSEVELLEVLSADDEVNEDFRKRSPLSPKVDQLPVVVWSRLYFDLAPYLSERSAEGTTLLAFYHNQLREVASEQYLADEHGPRRHTALAGYFRGRSDPAGDRTWTGAYARGLSELPFHLAEAGELGELYETLTDFKFLEHKAAEVAVAEHKDAEGNPTTTYAGVFQLQDDYELALAKLGGGPLPARKPLIVTAVALGQGMVIRCPWCNKPSPFQEQWRDSDLACPNPECNGPLRINKFVVGESLIEMGN